MEHLCVRCTRQALRSSSLPRRDATSVLVRHFSASSLRPAGPIDLSQPNDGDPSPRKPRQSDQNTTTPQPTGSSGFRITRTPVDYDNKSRSSTPQGRPLIRRTTNPSGQPPGVLVRRNNAPRTPGPPSAGDSTSRFAQRGSGPPRRGSGPPRRGGPPSSSSGARRPPRRPTPTEDVVDDYAEEEDAALLAYEAELAKSESNNGLPTEPLPYSPTDQTLTELRKDWPNTAASATGLTESVVQKMRWLARDLPHGYWTPRQLAERFVAGGLVRFEDEDHKAKVLEWAGRLVSEGRGKLEKWAAEKSFTGFEDVKHKEKMRVQLAKELAVNEGVVRDWAETKTVAGKEPVKGELDQLLGTAALETEGVLAQSVKGVYPELPKGQRPLIASVQRQLRNNGSYGVKDSEKLVGRITTLIESLQSQSQAAQAQAQAQAQQKSAAAN